MWSFIDKVSSDSVIRFSIEEDGVPLQNREFLELLKDSAKFRTFYNHRLAQSGLEAFFWENKPMTRYNQDEPYECTLVNSNYLAGKSPQPGTFRQYYKTGESIVTFPNLGRDALLVVPCPTMEEDCYTHLGNFVRSGGQEQIDDFWRVTANKMMVSLGNEPKWLSTSGLGVFWLHARIDSTPKYYQTEKYKKL
ncbi:hypothetical protein NC796_14655 [Aliifodinibius sp. S!AR15-10]|uniref:DUF6940 family protein n=1 Tax=Aliifodinibius sp. S!AR15-10 TaxID=2950437 RepID=UPI0028548D1C|nr:hypothetical protein [Aliifodinibius sp. S!AR15-10]MDR8392391.1 hypothetical protein [Aliifodinibius sp. S!AR15-10]